MIKILVAEDEEKSRAATVSRLRGIMGDEALIETAADGNDAVQMALKMRPALIFMDIEMPRKTGLEAAAILHEQLPDTHIVFLTAYDRFGLCVGALRTGGREYLLKPVSEPHCARRFEVFSCRARTGKGCLAVLRPRCACGLRSITPRILRSMMRRKAWA